MFGRRSLLAFLGNLRCLWSPDLEFPQIRQRHPKQGNRGQGQNPQREHRVDGNAMDREQITP